MQRGLSSESSSWKESRYMETVLHPALLQENAHLGDDRGGAQKEDKAPNRAEWRKKLISYTGDPE